MTAYPEVIPKKYASVRVDDDPLMTKEKAPSKWRRDVDPPWWRQSLIPLISLTQAGLGGKSPIPRFQGTSLTRVRSLLRIPLLFNCVTKSTRR
jgi:hypothetical protein